MLPICQLLPIWIKFCLQDVEQELQLQISLKMEMEMAMRLLEKDIHEKQDSIISLRKQLEDIKSINIDLYKKIQVRHRHFKPPPPKKKNI